MEEGHFLVLGWSEKVYSVLDQLSEELASAWLEAAAGRSGDADQRHEAQIELARLTGLKEAQGAGAVARSAINSLARLRWLGPLGFNVAKRLRRSLGQVQRYLTEAPVREAALDSVLRLVGPETRAIIGHSLGSVVAFEAAHRLEHPLPLLITLGSPLGLRTIVYDRVEPQPPVFPPQVARWVNVADRDDLIAAEPDLTPLFGPSVPAGARLEGGFTVDNGAKPHRADFYLTKAQVGRPLGEALRGVGPG